MKKVITLIILSNLFISLSHAQEATQQGGVNYTHFTKQGRKITNELETLTSKEFKDHPEYGVLPFNAPCKDCMELLQKRDEKHRYFVKEGTNGHEFYAQSSYSDLNYRDASGQLVTIDYRIKPTGENGVYSAMHQPFPLTVNVRDKYVSIKNGGKELLVNRNVTLYIKKTDGTFHSMGEPSWSDYSAGDDGVVIHNFYPGIDLELHTGEGHVESFYRINRPLHLDGGELVIHDNLQLPAGFVYDHSYSDKSADDRYDGPMYINSSTGKHYFIVAGPAAFDVNKSIGDKGYAIHLPYTTGQGGGLDLYMPIAWMNDPNRSYPLLIDPFVMASDSIPANTIFSGYDATCFANGCPYHLNTVVPAACHVTDIIYSFWYQALGTCDLDSAAFDITTGSCRYPAAGTWKTCNSALPGVCENTNLSLYNNCSCNIESCIPAPSCPSYTIPFTLTFYRCTSPGGTCSNFSCITSDANHTWSMTVVGYTAIVTATGATGCLGSTVNISAVADSGIAPYTYTWNPGNLTGDTVSVSPSTTTTYTVTASDCGGLNTVQATATVTIGNLAPAAGPDTSICSGVAVPLHATGGNTYSWMPAAGLSNSNIANPIATPSVTTTYTVMITAGNCDTSATVTVNVTPGGTPPVIYIYPDTPSTLPPFTIIAGDPVIFTVVDSGTGGQVVQLNATSVLLNGGYNASFTLLDSTSSSVARTFTYISSCNDVSATPYKVTFSGAGNQSFCSGITVPDSVYITVIPPLGILLDTIPNIITPNGDHLNDTLTLYRNFVEQGVTNCWSNLDVKIFNRWGELQYEYSSPTGLDLAWDGTNKSGDKVSDGVYYYIITADFMNKPVSKKGTVEVKR